MSRRTAPGVSKGTCPDLSEAGVPDVTVIVPTRNESANVKPLVARLSRALEGRSACVLFVDDSDDETPDQVREAGRTGTLPVHLMHRTGPDRDGGLGGAVLAGLSRTRSPWAVVMDGDLQHPPELVPELLAAGERLDADIVVASRHVPGGSADGLANGVRTAVSELSTLVSKALFPGRLRGVSDPMSGFFALRPKAFDLGSMHPDGFKILFELLARTPRLRKTEVPFTFCPREAGRSKAGLREGLRFGEQLVRDSGARLVPRGTGSGVKGLQATSLRALGFGLVGLTGLVVNLLVTWLVSDPSTLGAHYLLGAALATQVSSTWDFLLIDAAVYRGPKRNTRLLRWAGFMAMSNLVLLLRFPVLALLVTVLGLHYLLATALTLTLAFLVRFKSQERLTLKEVTP